MKVNPKLKVAKLSLKKLETFLYYTVQKVFRHVKPFRRDPRV